MVQPVTRGERLVAVTWVQSLVRQADRRRLLVQLAEARDLQLDDYDLIVSDYEPVIARAAARRCAGYAPAPSRPTIHCRAWPGWEFR